jgi:hypothetical protein
LKLGSTAGAHVPSHFFGAARVSGGKQNCETKSKGQAGKGFLTRKRERSEGAKIS